jgi:hypothetical protein
MRQLPSKWLAAPDGARVTLTASFGTRKVEREALA